MRGKGIEPASSCSLTQVVCFSFGYIPAHDMIILKLGEKLERGSRYNLTFEFEGLAKFQIL
jgi:hypothetical protein